jgi:hypothetical protein
MIVGHDLAAVLVTTQAGAGHLTAGQMGALGSGQSAWSVGVSGWNLAGNPVMTGSGGAERTY